MEDRVLHCTDEGRVKKPHCYKRKGNPLGVPSAV